MAQYGKNYYGASYYGASGVFAGQFNSDKTNLLTPLGGLVFDMECSLPRSSYEFPLSYDMELDEYASSVFRVEGTWTNGSTTDREAIATAAFTGSSFSVHFDINAESGGIALVDAKKYVNGVLDKSVTLYVNTDLEAIADFSDEGFGEWVVDISIDESSLEGESISISHMDVVTSDISLELSTMDDTGTWSQWARVPLSFTYDDIEEIYDITTGIVDSITDETATVSISTAHGYEFRLLMATSDTDSSPEVLRLDIRTSNIDMRSERGMWRMLIDLENGEGIIGDIESISYDAVVPKGTSLEIRTRTTADTDVENEMMEERYISWGDWSVPYSNGTSRIIIDTKESPSATSGVVYTPVITPQNLSTWSYMIPQLFINYRDPAQMDLDRDTYVRHSNVRIELLDGNLNIIRARDLWGSYDEARYTFNAPLQRTLYYQSTTGGDISLPVEYTSYIVVKSSGGSDRVLVKGLDYTVAGSVLTLADDIETGEEVAIVPAVFIEAAKVPIRLRIILNRDTMYSTPAVEFITLVANAEYVETKKFAEGFNEAYASAVFGDNTGDDYLYTDGISRLILANIENLDFTLPTRETPLGPTIFDRAKYSIDNEARNAYTQSVNIYWEGTNNKETYDPLDALKAKVTPDGLRIRKHVQYGSGITMSIDEEDFPDVHNATSIFSPPLDMTKSFAYHIRNGHTDPSSVNTNVNIRWQSEDSLDEVDRRNIEYSPNKEIYTSIISAVSGNIVDWKSEEILAEGIVNANSIESPYEAILTERLPEIPPDAIITDPTPYKVEIVPNTVISEGEIKEDSRVNLWVDDTAEVFKEITEQKVLLIRGPANTNQDFLPKANTTSVYGIYVSLASYSPTYWEGTHFTVVDGKMIDWSIIMNDPGYVGPKPAPGDYLYVTYTYNKQAEIKVNASCRYNRNDYALVDIYRTPTALEYEGRCSLGLDYESESIDINSEWSIPETVDRTTLSLKAVIKDNPFVRAYVKDDKIVVTLGNTNPRENWNPQIMEGFYYLGHDGYYMMTSPNLYELDKGLIPKAENISYVSGVGIVLQEATVNMLTNPSFSPSETSIPIFRDTFER